MQVSKEELEIGLTLAVQLAPLWMKSGSVCKIIIMYSKA